MAVTLDTTIGGASANAYCTLAEAATYHESHPYATVWEDAIDDERNRAIVTATRLLDQHIGWFGWVVNSVQARQWPRVGCITRGGAYPVLSTVVPEDVKRATAELARQLLASDRTADSDVETQGLTSLTAGSVAMTFDQARVKVKVIPDAVASMIDYLGTVKARTATSVSLARM